jgi:nucleoid-associated protein YgaU
MPNRIQRRKFTNREELYKNTFKERGVNHIEQYVTPILNHPNAEQLRGIQKITHIWKLGDRYSKLAHVHYGDARYWWVIAWYNQKPTESHVKVGEGVYIPKPLNRVLSLLRGDNS